MLHHMLRCSEASTDLVFVDIATIPLEILPSVKVAIRKASENITENVTVEDDAEIGNECNNAREQLTLPSYRQSLSTQSLIISEEKE